MSRIQPTLATYRCLCSVLSAAIITGCQHETFNRDPAAYIDDTDLVAMRLDAEASPPQQGQSTPKPTLKALPTNLDPPASPAEFRQSWHFKPVNQGRTGHCWSFATTSFFESEIHRLSKREIKLSELHTVYWEYLEKARRFVREHGNSEFGRGSEPNAVIRIWRKYGVVPENAYPGLLPGRKFHDDRRLCAQIREYLDSLREKNTWDEKSAVTTVRAILDRHLGPPPLSLDWKGRTMTPQEFLHNVVKLNLDDYVSVLSLMNEPFNAWCEYRVPDNWWHSREYFNVCLDDFMTIVDRATRDGQTMCLGIDNTEPGFLYRQNVAFIPTFDIPDFSIDDAARQIRFNNGSTTDDHAVHLVGSCRQHRQPWYLIKDSDTGPLNGPHKGYMFYREDYLGLKTLFILLPRDTVEKALGRSIGSPASAPTGNE
ncbi:MAG TPA: C1 family peptidase [Phycisphaerae bacterium]|nr:C1 family peptidase [Phycisphaerae bacterium]HRY69341.1 C1 family peptidase [Phycisphaerae bacterium]HSA26208.1 C1 family peptidase [Phycisphaerae bacterium]